ERSEPHGLSRHDGVPLAPSAVDDRRRDPVAGGQRSAEGRGARLDPPGLTGPAGDLERSRLGRASHAPSHASDESASGSGRAKIASGPEKACGCSVLSTNAPPSTATPTPSAERGVCHSPARKSSGTAWAR